MSTTTIRPASEAGRLMGARQLAEVVRRVAARPAEWLTRVRLNPAGRWYDQLHIDDSHEVWLISWLPGQETGFHDHGGAAGAFTVVLGTLVESQVVTPGGPGGGLPPAQDSRQLVSRPVGAGATRSFGPRYVHNVRNSEAASLAVSVHAYSPPLSAMTRYELTQSGLVALRTEEATAWSAA